MAQDKRPGFFFVSLVKLFKLSADNKSDEARGDGLNPSRVWLSMVCFPLCRLWPLGLPLFEKLGHIITGESTGHPCWVGSAKMSLAN
jgi:hypothetical protein